MGWMEEKAKTRGGWETDTHGKGLSPEVSMKIERSENGIILKTAEAELIRDHRGQEMGASSSRRENK